MNLKNKAGFLIDGAFYSNFGSGHESNAIKIITNKGWLDEWSSGSAQDFLVCEKKAIQIGSGIYYDHIIASKRFYTEATISKIARHFCIDEYRRDLIL